MHKVIGQSIAAVGAINKMKGARKELEQMKTSIYAGVALAALLVILANHALAAESNNGSRVPVLLELFTSEGCSSCPPADRLLEAFDTTQPFATADLIVLSEHVDYWDRLGWKDPYSHPQFSARQQEYADRFNRDGVYTPQLVVDGRFELVGSDQRAASSAIQKAAGEPKIPIVLSNVVRQGSQITASIEVRGQNGNSKGVLYVAVASDRAESHVARGENAGRSLAHVAVTRVLTQVGTADLASPSTRDVTVIIPPGVDVNASRLIVFIQDARSAHVLGVAERRI